MFWHGKRGDPIFQDSGLPRVECFVRRARKNFASYAIDIPERQKCCSLWANKVFYKFYVLVSKLSVKCVSVYSNNLIVTTYKKTPGGDKDVPSRN
jgi:hypothetical protein